MTAINPLCPQSTGRLVNYILGNKQWTILFLKYLIALIQNFDVPQIQIVSKRAYNKLQITLYHMVLRKMILGSEYILSTILENICLHNQHCLTTLSLVFQGMDIVLVWRYIVSYIRIDITMTYSKSNMFVIPKMCCIFCLYSCNFKMACKSYFILNMS